MAINLLIVKWVIIGIVYLIITSFIYIKRIKILGFQLFPLGVSTKHLNGLINWMGRNFKQLFDKLGSVGYVIFGTASIFFGPSIIIGSVLYFIDNPTMLGLMRYYDIYYSIVGGIDFDSTLYWMVIFGSIFIHELFHGVAARAKDINVEGMGAVAIPGILYGAYVKIDYDGFMGINSWEETQDETMEDIDTVSEEEKQKYLFLIELRDKSRKLQRNRMENYQKSNSSPFIIPDRDKRHSLGSVLSAGLVANTLLVFLGILLWNIQSLHDLVRALISVNLSLIALNLFFITITDGGKLFKLRVQDLFSANISTTILKIYSSVGKLIIYVILVLVAF